MYQLPKRSHPYYNYFCPALVCYFGPNVQAIYYYNPSTKIRKIAINFSGGWTNGTYTCVKGEPRPPILKVNFCFGWLKVVKTNIYNKVLPKQQPQIRLQYFIVWCRRFISPRNLKNVLKMGCFVFKIISWRPSLWFQQCNSNKNTLTCKSRLLLNIW